MAVKKKMAGFWKAFIAVTVILFIALGAWLVFLYGWLGDYEAHQPKYLAEDTFREHFENFDPREYVKLCNMDSESLETEDNIVEYLESVTKDKKITYKRVSSGMDSGYKYIVLAGDDEVRFASFILSEDTEKSAKFKNYCANSFEYYTDAKNTVTVEVPKGYTVKINSKALTESYITEDDIKTESCDYMPEGVLGLYYTKYTVKGLIDTPSVEVISQDGTAAEIDTDNNSYKALPIYDSALADKYTDWILEGVEKYAKYSQYDSNVNVTGFNQVAPFFDPDSELYESIKTMDNMFVIHYDKYEFTDMEASEFYSYDESTFSCRVQYTQKLYKGNDLYDDFVDQTLYLRLVDGEYRIYEMKVN